MLHMQVLRFNKNQCGKMFIFSDKPTARSFLSDHTEVIKNSYKQGQQELVTWAKNLQTSMSKSKGRKRKKTSKLLEMELDISDTSLTIKKASGQQITKETEKMQAIEYFKKKKAVGFITFLKYAPKNVRVVYFNQIDIC